jgi:hypothetical protein
MENTKMQAMSRFKLGGILLAAGTALVLILKLQWILFPEENSSLIDNVVINIVGYWFASLVMPLIIDGITYQFSWVSLIWLPWAGVFIAFLLWVAIKVIRGQFRSDFVPLPILGVFGGWFLIALLYDKFTRGFYNFEFDLRWLIAELFSDLATITIIIGLGLIIFSYKK